MKASSFGVKYKLQLYLVNTTDCGLISVVGTASTGVLASSKKTLERRDIDNAGNATGAE